MKKIFLVSIVFILLLNSYKVSCDPTLDRVWLIDEYGDNLLYRGNDPTDNGEFQYEKLTKIMAERAKLSGVKFPEVFQMCVISVLTDNLVNEIEADFFKQHPDLGYFMNIPLKSEGKFPGDYNLIERNIMAAGYDTWTIDHLGQVGDTIRSQLVDTNPIPRVVIFHCISGIQLVHLPFGGYQLQIHNDTNREVVSWYTERNLPYPKQEYQNSVEWFCLNHQLQTMINDGQFYDYDCLYRKFDE